MQMMYCVDDVTDIHHVRAYSSLAKVYIVFQRKYHWPG